MQVQTWKSLHVRTLEARLQNFLLCSRTKTSNSTRRCNNSNEGLKKGFLLHPVCKLNKNIFSLSGWFHMKHTCSHKVMSCSGRFKQRFSVLFVQLVVAVLLIASVSVAVSETSSCKIIFVYKVFMECWKLWENWFIYAAFFPNPYFYCSVALSEENQLFLEAWRTIDRAYIDKTFNGQSWFRYRENALQTEPMNNREETCM